MPGRGLRILTMSHSESSIPIHLIGVISDTHGLLRPEVVKALQGCEWIIHAGDIGKPEVLEALRAIAPVVAVRGNMDFGAWVESLPLTATLEVGEVRLYIRHNPYELDLDPVAAGFDVVITGHTHTPALHRKGALYVNPGAAGPRRFHRPVSLARLQIRGDLVGAELVEIQE